MSFWQNAGSEIIRGIIGGLVVLFATSLWYTFRTFKIRFLNPNEPLKAENIRQCTAIRTDVGLCNFRVKLTPRIGVDLIQHNFAFFNRGKLPCLVGLRRSTDEIAVIGMRYFNNHLGKYVDVDLETDNEGVTATKHSFSLSGGSCTYYELDVRIANALKDWEGILSFKILYQRDGNPEAKCVRTKFFVRSSEKQRPFRSIFKKVLKCEPLRLVPDKKDSKND